MNAFATLRSLVRSNSRQAEPAERCEMCGAALPGRHAHLVDATSRKLICSCDACGILFHSSGETKLKAVPRDARMLHGFQLTDGQWDSFMIPISLAFFLKSSADQRVMAFYPSPAGSIESMLSLDAWTELATDNPVLEEMHADVEALLVNRLAEPPEYYLAPIDRCYELVGLIRSHWHGLSGGDKMWTRIREYFAELKDIARA